MQTYNFVLVDAGTFLGFLRWAALVFLVVVTFYLIHRGSKAKNISFGLLTLVLTVIMTPILLLDVVYNYSDEEEIAVVPNTSDDTPDVKPDAIPDDDGYIPSNNNGPNNSSTPSGSEGSSDSGSESEPEPEPVYRSINIEDAVIINPSADGKYLVGSKVKISAEDRVGYHPKWLSTSSVVDGKTDNPYEFTMPDEDLEIRVTYEINQYTLTVEHADYVVTDISGSYDYLTNLSVTAKNREDKGFFFEKWVNAQDEILSTDVTYSFTMPASDLTIYPVYRFVDPFPVVWSQEGACNFSAYYESGNVAHGHVDGTYCGQYAGNEYIDTRIALYSSENINKDYEVSFTIEHFAADEQLENDQETVFTDKGYHWKSGIVYRLATDQMELVSRKADGNAGKNDVKIPVADGQRVSIMRYNGDLYYKIDDGNYILLQEDADDIQEGSFDTTAWFGAAPDSDDGSVQKRFITGSLSNMSVRLGENNLHDYYKITFVPKGGSLANKEILVKEGGTLGELPVPTRSKYAFVGWFDNSGIQISSNTVPEGDTSYEAKWTSDITNAKLADNSIEMVIGENAQIRISNRDSIEPISFSSSNSSVASVDANTGLVTAVGAGETDIIITGTLSGLTRTVHITVYSARYTVHFDAQGGSSVDDVVVYPGSKIDPLPRTTYDGYTFLGWFDISENELTEETEITQNGVTYYARWDEGAADVVMVCKKAETLHEETCERSSDGCSAAGYGLHSTITYGTLPGVGEPQVGDAYDCDVNGDNKYNSNTERFYYLRANGSNGVLVSFSNFEGSLGQLNNNIFSYDLVQDKLPTTTQWGNEELEQFDGKPARILAKSEIEEACNGSSATGSLDGCQFLLENTKFQSENIGRSAIWLVSNNGSYNRIFAPDRAIRSVDSDSNNAVRPVIEVPLTLIQQGNNNNITFVYGDGRPDYRRQIAPGEIVGPLPVVSDTEHANFLGWYTASEGGTKISKYTVPSGDTYYYAHWEAEQFTIDFNTHGGSAVASVTREYGQALGEFSSNLEGYDFGGWYTAENGGGTKYEANTEITSNVTLHAKWDVQSFNVTFNLNYDSLSNTIQVDYNTEIGALTPSDPTRKHYGFTGWYTASDGGEVVENIASYVVSSDVEFFAHWDPIAVCKVAKEETLHTEQCVNSGKGCNNSSFSPKYNLNDYITYGSVYNDTLAAGNAFNCDVNGDGTFDNDSERFYYLYSNDGIATLIYHKNSVAGETIAYGSNNYLVPTNSLNKIPTTSVWSNVELSTTTRQILNEKDGTTVGSGSGAKNLPEIDYSGLAARMPTIQDIKTACGLNSVGTNGELAKCNYLLEQTTYANASNTGFASAYWLATPISNSTSNVYRTHGSSAFNGSAASTNNTGSGIRPVIEVPLDLFDYTFEEEHQSPEVVTFNTSNNAVKGYYNTISNWLPQLTTFNKDTTTINNSTWGTVSKADFEAGLKSNFETNGCNTYSSIYGNESSYNWTSGATDCSKPLAYNTSVGAPLKVYLYDEATETVGAEVLYTKSSNGLIYNMIPGQAYYWEKDGDNSVNGYVKAEAENGRRFIDANGIRNVRDLGGLQGDKDGDGVVDGTLKYGQLFRGERLWTNQDDVDYLSDLGVDKEYALVKTTDDPWTNDLKLSDVTQRDFIHYNLDYDSGNYGIDRQTVTEVMQDIVSGKSIYFHCRVGADRTGTLAYILEGLLGVPDEERYEDYELTHLSGLTDRIRYYTVKPNGQAPNDKKFVYMMGYLLTNQDIYEWYTKDRTAEQKAEDDALIQSFRNAMIE